MAAVKVYLLLFKFVFSKHKNPRCFLIYPKDEHPECDAAIKQSDVISASSSYHNSRQLTNHGADLPGHEHGHRVIVQTDVYDALSDRLAHFGPQQHGAQRLKDGRKDAGLPQRDHAGPHRRAEGVGHIVGAH